MVWASYNMLIIITIIIKNDNALFVYLFTVHALHCIRICSLLCPGRHPVCLKRVVSHPEIWCAVWWLLVSEGHTLKCQCFLRLQVWLSVIKCATWVNKNRGWHWMTAQRNSCIYLTFFHCADLCKSTQSAWTFSDCVTLQT